MIVCPTSDIRTSKKCCRSIPSSVPCGNSFDFGSGIEKDLLDVCHHYFADDAATSSRTCSIFHSSHPSTASESLATKTESSAVKDEFLSSFFIRPKVVPSADNATVNDESLKNLQQRLIHLYHAKNCEDSNAFPPRPCRISRQCLDNLYALRHMLTCVDANKCNFPECSLTFCLTEHNRTCSIPTCSLCEPLNETKKRKRSRQSLTVTRPSMPSSVINKPANIFIPDPYNSSGNSSVVTTPTADNASCYSLASSSYPLRPSLSSQTSAETISVFPLSSHSADTMESCDSRFVAPDDIPEEWLDELRTDLIMLCGNCEAI